MIGIVFGRLVVIERDLTARKNKALYWKCLCECGRYTVRCTADLNRSGRFGKASCRGCAQSLNRRKDMGASTWAQIEQAYRQGAKNRNLLFELTLDQIKLVCGQSCHYCNRPPTPKNRYIRADGSMKDPDVTEISAQRGWINANGIDRKDNSLGYTLVNCLPCCWKCNAMKKDLPYVVFIEQCRTIAHNMEML